MHSMDLVTPGAANVGLFVSAALVLLITPGPAVLYIVARSAEQGRLAGFVSDLGIHSATLVHVLAAAFGLSALLASSALAFSVV
jgi:threonine/homoserine/homoserine lactone efflux protein